MGFMNLGPTRKSMLPMDNMLPKVKHTANGLGLPSMSSVKRTIENMLRKSPDITHPANPIMRSCLEAQIIGIMFQFTSQH